MRMLGPIGRDWRHRTGASAKMALLALLSILAVASGIGACGGASTETRVGSHTLSSTASRSRTAKSATGVTSSFDYGETKVDLDKDNDVGAPADDKNNNSELYFGRAAGATDRRAIVALVKRYYAAALASDGTKGCAMIYSPLAESIPEDFGAAVPAGPPYMRGTSCPAVVSGLFRHFHAQIAAEVPKLAVTRVRLEEHHGLALLSFGKQPERKINVIREGRVWRMAAMIDRPLS